MNKELHEFIDKFNLIERTFKYAKEALENYIKEVPEDAAELSPECVKFKLGECYYFVTGYGTKHEQEYIEVEIHFYNDKENFLLGYYHMVYNYSNGEEFDDTLNITGKHYG